jgi:hypothetical protein
MLRHGSSEFDAWCDPSEEQTILLQRLGLALPERLRVPQAVEM